MTSDTAMARPSYTVLVGGHRKSSLCNCRCPDLPKERLEGISLLYNLTLLVGAMRNSLLHHWEMKGSSDI